jgi:hypothetical protein
MANIKVVRVTSEDWVKATKTADESGLVQMFENKEEKLVPFVYVHKSKKKPDKWIFFAIVNAVEQKGRMILDELAQKLGYSLGILDTNFVRKYVRDFPTRILRDNSKFKVFVITGKEWLKATKKSDETEILKELESSQSIPFVYVHKNKKKPDSWFIMAIFDSSSKEARDIIDSIAQKMGYNEGLMNKEFQQKFIRKNLK